MAGEMGAFVAGSIVGKLLLDKTGWNQSVREVTEKDKKGLSGAINSISREMGQMGKTMTYAGGIIVGTLGGMLISTAKAGDEISKLSQKLGISTELLSGYKVAAELSGSSVGGFAIGMRNLANHMVAANTGGKESQEIFKALGVSYADNEGRLRPLNEVMLDVADRFSQMEDGETKLSLATHVLGRSGMELIPMFNEGREGLKRYWEEAKRTGVILSKDAAQSCVDFNDALTILKVGIGGTAKEIALQLMPMATALITKAKEVVIQVREWIAEHPALVKWITESGLKLGILLTGAGMFLIMIPKLVTGIRLLTASYGGLGAALMIAYGAYKLLEKIRPGERISEEVAAYGKLTKAIGYWSDFEDAAVRASISKRAELHAVWDKYGQNTLETFKAIAEGKEGEALKKFLDDLSKGHSKALIATEDQKKGLEDLKDFYPKLTATITTEVTNIDRVVSKNWADISRLTVQLWKDNVIGFQKIGEAIDAVPPKAHDLSFAFSIMSKGIGQTMVDFAADIGVQSTEVMAYIYDVRKTLLGLVGITIPSVDWSKFTQGAKTATKDTGGYFDGLYNDIATGWGNTVQKWMEGGSTLKDFVKGLWEDIKSSFFRMIGEMVADWVLGQFKKLFSTIADTATKTITDVGTALSGAASGWATGIGAAIGSFIGTFLANLVAGGPSGHAQEQMINDMKDSRNFLAEIRNWFVGAGTGYGGASYEFITGHIGDWLGWINESVRSLEKTSCGYLKTIAEGIAGLPSAQAGAYVSRPALVHVHAGEYIIPRNYTPALNKLPATINKAVKPTVIENHIYIDGREIKLFITKTVRESGGLGLLGSVGKAMA